jgi:hypothetical protein
VQYSTLQQQHAATAAVATAARHPAARFRRAFARLSFRNNSYDVACLFDRQTDLLDVGLELGRRCVEQRRRDRCDRVVVRPALVHDSAARCNTAHHVAT